MNSKLLDFSAYRTEETRQHIHSNSLGCLGGGLDVRAMVEPSFDHPRVSIIPVSKVECYVSVLIFRFDISARV